MKTKYAMFTPNFTPTGERTDKGQMIFSVDMVETPIKGDTLGQAFENAKKKFRIPIVGPRS